MSSLATSSIRGREAGKRNEGKQKLKAGMPTVFGLNNTNIGSLNHSQMSEIQTLFSTHTAVHAAKTVLYSQLFSGGLALFRNGKMQRVVNEKRQATASFSSPSSSSAPTRAPSENGDADDESGGIREAFNQHLQTHWLKFAKDVLDCFLMWGVVPVTFELEQEDECRAAARLAKVEEKISAPLSGKRMSDATMTKRLIPMVPTFGTYSINYKYVGRYGYNRKYELVPHSPENSIDPDDQAVVFVHTEPDTAGNVNSPISSIYQLGSFVASLTELAMVAEISRATPQIITQIRPPQKSTGLDPGALFFDQESRNVQSGQATEESQIAAHNLEMQSRLCAVINKLQSTHAREPGGSASTSSAHQPHDIQPKLFCIPKDQELAPSNKPEARSDLEALQRLSIEQVSAALGVPASLIFEGRYAGKSSQQLQLLNSTVSQLASSINRVLTSVYLSLYPDEERVDVTGARLEAANTNLELKLRTSPLSASEEIVNLYGAGLVDGETAVPAVMHSLGASSDEIDAALQRMRAKEEKECACDDENKELDLESKKLSVETAKVNLKQAKQTSAPAKSSASSASSGAAAASASSGSTSSS